MPNEDDDVMVGVIRDLVRRVETYEQQASASRAAFQQVIELSLVQLRKDMHAAISRLQMDAAQHRDEHAAERKERAVDAIDRLNRQLVLNLWLGALTILVVINLLLIGFVVIRAVQVLYGR